MAYVTKRRTLRTRTYNGTSYRDRTKVGLEFGEFPFSVTLYDRQVTVSEGHRWPEGRGVRDIGGNFDTVKLTYDSSEGPDTVFSTGKRSTATSDLWYVGNCIANISSATGAAPAAFTNSEAVDADLFNWVPSSSSNLTTLGTTFISDTLPTNPTVDGAVSLAELYREGLPHIIGSSLKESTSFFRTLGSEYLSFEFGWKPFVSDLKSAAKAIIDSDDILKQMERDSGRNVRRHRSIPRKTITNTVFPESNVVFMSNIEAGAFSGPTTYRVSDLLTREQSFSGCYTFYYEPAMQSQVSRIATQARLLYGLELSPEVVWNLAPWSWLIDWVAEVGPLMNNVSAFSQDGLVLRYGYVMEENFRRVTRTNMRANVPRGTDLPREVRDTFSGKRLMRRKATPYGFGLDFAGFSTRQWSILGALGITLAPRRL